jgi:hypothetical protein
MANTENKAHAGDPFMDALAMLDMLNGKDNLPEILAELRQSNTQTATKNASDSAGSQTKNPHVITLSPDQLHETPENFHVYRRPNENDPVWLELRKSIAEHGVTSPLEVTRDNYIVSGHRRRYASQLEGKLVPCIVVPILMGALSPNERVRLLVSRNQGIRVKTDGEAYMEAAAAVDPDKAMRDAQSRKAQVFNKVKTSGITEVLSTGDIRRTDPSGEREEFLKAVLGIIAEKRRNGYLPTSGRHIHYSLLRLNVRTSKRKNGYIYGKAPARHNSDGTKKPDPSSTLLSKLLTDARSAGLIDPDDINDDTRPTSQITTSETIGGYVSETLDDLFSSYCSDVHKDQSVHLELLVEKNTIYPLLRKHVAWKYRLPITSMHGYGSYPAARDVAKRFKDSGKDKLVIVYVSDLDPEGVDMPSSWKKYLEHDFGVVATVFRAAVTPGQVTNYQLPPDADVKLSSTRAPRFVAEYGDRCWEVDSMPEPVLIKEVSKVIESILDITALNKAFEAEKQADVKLARLQAAVRRFVTERLANGEGL